MANQVQKKGSGGRTGPRRESARRDREDAAFEKREAETGRSYVMAAFVLFFLGFSSVIGWFSAVDAIFIRHFCGFVKGLIGYGYSVFPLALLASAVFFLLRRNHSAVLSAVYMLLVPLAIGALAHVLLNGDMAPDPEQVGSFVGRLFSTGQEYRSGGVLGGGLGWMLRSFFSVYAAVPMLLFALAALLLAALRTTPAAVLAWCSAFAARQREAWDRLADEGEEDLALAEEVPFRPQPEEQRRSRRHAITLLPEEAEPVQAIPAAPALRPEPPEPPAPSEPEGFEDFRVEPLHRGPASRGGKARTAQTEERTPEPPQDVPAFREPAASEVQAEGYSTEVARSIRSSSRKGLDTEELIHETTEVARAVERKDASLASEPMYEFPPLSLLHFGEGGVVDGREEMSLNRSRLQATLDSFGVSAKIVDTTRGPTVTRYDLELESGVKLAKLTNLAGDLALSLGVTGVRIAPIPNKISTVGIEVPNKIVSRVYLRDIVDTDIFRNAPSKLSFAIGKDIAGNAIVGSIAKLPHLLIAGTTGSGKSVFMNCLILSLLYKSTPEEVRLIMIDPKMVELGVYNGIPHLYIPVVTDARKAAGSLQWAVVEMLKRYRQFSELGVRDLTGYNTLQRREGKPTLPRVVVVIDELADLMMVASKEVEESICRVAQMGRAAGMHLVIATQRPSADVITGLMKANIPSRVAFAVSSSIDSRIILDQVGAEKLIGYGDMLYAPIGIGKPTRIQGAFVTDEERQDIVDYIKRNGEADYNQEIMTSIEQAAAEKEKPGTRAESAAGEPEQEGFDELLPQAVDVIFETKQASVSLLQRRLKLGYSRAARIMDQMEELGVVGPFEGSRPRQILRTHEQWLEMQQIQGTAPQEKPAEDFDFAEFQDAPPEEWQS